MVMVGGRVGASGGAFNLGEMTVTRCVVQLVDGCTGHSYVAGRSRPHAELAALAAALLQSPQAARWMALVDTLEQEPAASRAGRGAPEAPPPEEFHHAVQAKIRQREGGLNQPSRAPLV